MKKFQKSIKDNWAAAWESKGEFVQITAHKDGYAIDVWRHDDPSDPHKIVSVVIGREEMEQLSSWLVNSLNPPLRYEYLEGDGFHHVRDTKERLLVGSFNKKFPGAKEEAISMRDRLNGMQ